MSLTKTRSTLAAAVVAALALAPAGSQAATAGASTGAAAPLASVATTTQLDYTGTRRVCRRVITSSGRVIYRCRWTTYG